MPNVTTHGYSKKLQEFVEGNVKNQWIDFGAINAYLRKSIRPGPDGKLHDFFDIASVSAKTQNKGHFTKFLTDVERLDINIYIESVLNDNLALFLEKRGYVRAKTYSSEDRNYFKMVERSDDRDFIFLKSNLVR